MRSFLRKNTKNIVIGLLCLTMHILLMLAFVPSDGDLVPTKTIKGIYKVNSDWGSAAPGVATRVSVSDIDLFCSASYLGAQGTCPDSQRNQTVTVRTATYRHSLGSDDIVIDVISDEGAATVYTSDLITKSWWQSSIFYAFLILQFQIPISIFLFNFLANRVKNHGR